MAKSVLIFEWMTGGGQFVDATLVNSSPDCGDAGLTQRDLNSSMAHEGYAMLATVAQDFTTLEFEVHTTIDSRSSQAPLPKATSHTIHSDQDLLIRLFDLAQKVDFVLLIAPESRNRLQWLANQLAPHKHKFLSPELDFIQLASDKTSTLNHLAEAGIPVPSGVSFSDIGTLEHQIPLPAVLKPNDGAGSEGNHWIGSSAELAQLLKTPRSQTTESGEGACQAIQWRLESWVPGRAASVSVIAQQQAEPIILPPTFQTLQDGRVSHWVDCEPVLDPQLIERARHLAKQVNRAMPDTWGYYGIDFVFGDKSEADTVIEINPRLTSSYAAIRSLVRFNLAEKMAVSADRRQLAR